MVAFRVVLLQAKIIRERMRQNVPHLANFLFLWPLLEFEGACIEQLGMLIDDLDDVVHVCLQLIHVNISTNQVFKPVVTSAGWHLTSGAHHHVTRESVFVFGRTDGLSLFLCLRKRLKVLVLLQERFLGVVS